MKLKYLLSVATGFAITVVFSGCLKSTPVEPPKPVSYVSVLNMSFKAPAVEMLFGSNKVTAPMSGGVYFTRYSPIDPGAINVTFKKASTDSLVAELPQGQFYDSSSYYSILLYDKENGSGSGAIRIRDEFPTADASRSYVRFFHMAPGQPQVDVQISNTKVFISRSQADNTYGSSYNQFTGITPGSFPIVVKRAGTDSVVATTTYSELIAGGIYTIVLKGTPAGTAAAGLGVEVIRASN